ncbi:MAG: O-antigen ligase family protein [Candidatus Omnitrophota bacterium]
MDIFQCFKSCLHDAAGRKKAVVWLDRSTEISLLAMIFVLPFSKSLIEIFFGCMLISWILGRYAAHEGKLSLSMFMPVRTKLNFPIVAFVLVGFLSTAKSNFIFLSLEGLFFKMLEHVVIYFIVVEIVTDRKKLKRVMIAIFCSMVLMALDGLFQFTMGKDFLRMYPLFQGRIQASFHNTNDFAAWLVIMIPLALSFAWFWKNEWLDLSDAQEHKWLRGIIKPVLWIITGALMVCVALTYTRAAWIAVIISIIFLGILKSRKLLVATMIALVVLSFVIPSAMRERAISVKTPIVMVVRFEEGKMNFRMGLWVTAMKIIKQHPWAGCGLNSYTAVAPRYGIPEAYYPHNSYLHMAAEMGLLGLGAFLWMVAALFRTALTGIRRIADGFYSACLAGFLAGFTGFLIHSFVDTNFYALQLGILMWIVMGLIIAVRKSA